MKFNSDTEAAKSLVEFYENLKHETAKVIVGQEDVIDKLLISLFTQNHALLIGVPGLAKTLLITTISQILGLSFNRIQFTPDLMPSDILGTEILDEHKNFHFIKGPIFANIILADEINRTPPKTQSALLEAMQERSVSIAGNTFELDRPFFVLATQNPIEQEGTYPLPEAQLDRFMFSIWLDYPTINEEIEIVKRTTFVDMPTVNNIIDKETLLEYQKLVRKINVPDHVYEFAVQITAKTRPVYSDSHPMAKEYVAWGGGPRSSQFMILGAKCHALLNGKYAPDNEDVKAVADSVFRHRLVLNYRAEAEGVNTIDIIHEIIKDIEKNNFKK
ncbi:MAG TPA: AAA family ATPase [Bacteroidales bacterium]|nr:AAA family ATPase [Bacteroidales bacterium]